MKPKIDAKKLRFKKETIINLEIKQKDAARGGEAVRGTSVLICQYRTECCSQNESCPTYCVSNEVCIC